MKFCTVALLLALCYFQSTIAARDWRPDVKYNHYKQITDIVNGALARIQGEVGAKGSTPAAKACYETARLKLRDTSRSAYSQVDTCVRNASTAGVAHVCCQQVDSSVFNQGFDVSREASACINRA